jgi:hypothetical protein
VSKIVLVVCSYFSSISAVYELYAIKKSTLWFGFRRLVARRRQRLHQSLAHPWFAIRSPLAPTCFLPFQITKKSIPLVQRRPQRGK